MWFDIGFVPWSIVFGVASCDEDRCVLFLFGPLVFAIGFDDDGGTA
jgi:hypothetical protein